VEWNDIQGKKYPGYGRCIYCGRDGGKDGLRSEHIIPFSLQGETEIKNANCVTCQNTINPIDTHLARTVFYEYRRHVGSPSRRPENQPQLPAVNFTIKGTEIERDLTVDCRPYSLAMPVWGLPGFYRRAPIDDPFPEVYCHMYHHLPPNVHETLGLEQDDDFIVWSNTAINISLFARAIAKIAYCHAVLQYGLDGFRPLILPDIILGRSRATPYFVGAPLDEPPPPLEKGRRHLVEFTHLDANPMHPSNALGELRLIIANIRLFADSGTIQHGLPIYRVICGARSPAMIRTLKPVPQTSRVIVL
jgi:hypothetical protein